MCSKDKFQFTTVQNPTLQREDHRGSQTAQYLQSSPDMVSLNDVVKEVGSPNIIVNISQEMVTKRPRDETSDFFDMTSRSRPRSVHKNSSVEFRSRGQVSREAGFSKLVEFNQYFVTRLKILLAKQGITTTCR